MARARSRIQVGFAFVVSLPLCIASLSGCAQSHFASASASLERNDHAGAVKHLETGAARGDRRCAYLLGSILIAGNGVDRDLEAGTRWMREAAEAELPVAQAYLGTLYANGEGVERDPEIAAEWYRKAAEYGNALGQAALGAALFDGVGVDRDPIEGYVWTKLAADQGFEKAKNNLSEMSSSLNDAEREGADRRVARFSPKENVDDGDPNYSGNRRTRASNNVRRGGTGRAFGTTSRAAGGY